MNTPPTLLFERRGYTIFKNHFEDGVCPTCPTPILGVWNQPQNC